MEAVLVRGVLMRRVGDAAPRLSALRIFNPLTGNKTSSPFSLIPLRRRGRGPLVGRVGPARAVFGARMHA